MKTKAWEVTDFASVYKALGLNLTSVLALRYYCEKHPMKTDVLMNKVPAIFTVDPILSRMKESKSLEAMFKKLSVYSFFLANSDKEHYAFIGKFQNDTMLNVQVGKKVKNRYVNLTIACVLAAQQIAKQISEERKMQEDKKDLIKHQDSEQVYEDILPSSYADTSEVQDAPIVANEVLMDQAPAANISPEMMKSLTMSKSNMTFKDLPLDLQRTIERDFEKMTNSTNPS